MLKARLALIAKPFLQPDLNHDRHAKQLFPNETIDLNRHPQCFSYHKIHKR